MAERIITFLVRCPLTPVALVFNAIFPFTPGSKHVGSFRSPNEFFLHGRWLIMGADMNPKGSPDCACRYCGETRSQEDIDKEFQLPGRTGSGHPGHHSSRPGGSSSAATSGTIINQAKDYRLLPNKPTTGYGFQPLSYPGMTVCS